MSVPAVIAKYITFNELAGPERKREDFEGIVNASSELVNEGVTTSVHEALPALLESVEGMVYKCERILADLSAPKPTYLLVFSSRDSKQNTPVSYAVDKVELNAEQTVIDRMTILGDVSNLASAVIA